MLLSFVKTSPSGNTTVLVKTPVPRDLHGAAARALMAPESVGAEQVAFREPSQMARERMQMMGGEFCVNAAMSMAACFLLEDGGEEGEYPLEASGCAKPLRVRAKKAGEGAYACQAPLPGSARVEGDRVYLPGIAHRVIYDAPWPGCEEELRAWARDEGGEAYGFIFAGGPVIRPLVYVPGAETLVWENACGSGAAALAAIKASRNQAPAEITAPMPGGSLTAGAGWENGAPGGIWVRNLVKIVIAGQIWLEL